jgi:hypothetical protein
MVNDKAAAVGTPEDNRSREYLMRLSSANSRPGRSLIDAIIGRPIPSNEAGEQRLGSAAGVPTFGLDALSSAAYGPEAALIRCC